MAPTDRITKTNIDLEMAKASLLILSLAITIPLYKIALFYDRSPIGAGIMPDLPEELE